jgi:hypothetical protein
MSTTTARPRAGHCIGAALLVVGLALGVLFTSAGADAGAATTTLKSAATTGHQASQAAHRSRRHMRHRRGHHRAKHRRRTVHAATCRSSVKRRCVRVRRASASVRFVPGLQGGRDLFASQVSQQLGARAVRVEFDISTPVSEMTATMTNYADRGIRVLLLAGFWKKIPTTGEAQNLASWAHAFGPGGTFWAGRSDGSLAVQDIEFGNESSYSYMGTYTQGGAYALRLRDAQTAVQASNSRVGLIAQADDANMGSAWVNAMFDAVPDLASRVSGWSVHPYGPQSSWQPRLDRLISQTAARGAPNTIPIDITEWGVASDNGHCLSANYGWSNCMTYGQAASALRSSLDGMKARYGSRLGYLMAYTGHDGAASGATSDKEAYFGVVQENQADKGAYTTAVKSFLQRG